MHGLHSYEKVLWRTRLSSLCVFLDAYLRSLDVVDCLIGVHPVICTKVHYHEKALYYKSTIFFFFYESNSFFPSQLKGNLCSDKVASGKLFFLEVQRERQETTSVGGFYNKI